MPPFVFDPHPTLGAIQIGVLVSQFMFGIFTLQVYIYFVNFPKDSTFYKSVVGILWLGELGHGVCITYGIYTMTISYYGHPERLIRTPSGLNAAILFGAIIDTLVQAAFAYRIYKLSHRMVIPILCWILALVHVGLSFTTAIKSFSMPSVATYVEQNTWILTSIFSIAAAVDAIITLTIFYYLMRERKHAMARRTVKMLDKLIIWSLQTGLLTGLGAIATLVCFLCLRGNYAWIAIFLNSTGLYANSLLAVLNGRVTLEKEATTLIEFTTCQPGDTFSRSGGDTLSRSGGDTHEASGSGHTSNPMYPSSQLESKTPIEVQVSTIDDHKSATSIP